MQWFDTGIVLSARKHGETSAIVHVLTAEHGRHAGLVRGGAGRRARSIVQAGNELQLIWRARLSEHLGTFTLELTRARAAEVLHDPLRLAAFSAATETVDAALPERAPDAEGYAAFVALLDAVEREADWPVAYVRWELALLASLGFGLDLASMRTETDLARNPWIASDRTGAVRTGTPFEAAGERWLPVPPFISGQAAPAHPALRRAAIAQGLRLGSAFLPAALHDQKTRLPARNRLVERLARSTGDPLGVV